MAQSGRNFRWKIGPNHQSIPGRTLTILDIGTGTGNIAVSLAKNLPQAKIFATDISKEALELAKENAKLNKVADKIVFLQSDLLSVFDFPLCPSYSSLILVANLPYIPTVRIPYLDPSVKDFEPRIALDGGPDGFDLYRKLFQQIVEKKLNPKLIVCEIDYTQGELAIQEAQKLVVSEVEPYFPNASVEVKYDLAQKQRILLILLLSLDSKSR